MMRDAVATTRGPLTDDRCHKNHCSVVANIWRQSGGMNQCPDGRNKFNDKWDGTYKVDDPHLFRSIAWCGDPSWHPNCSSKRPDYHNDGGDRARFENNENNVARCPNGYYCSGLVHNPDGESWWWGKPHFLSNCRRYPDPGLCSVGLFDPNVVDENTRGDEMIRSCHQDYDPTKDDGSITKSTCAMKAFEFCVKEKRGHWAPEKCIEVIENCFASKDEFESRFKADINRLLIDYMIKVRELESKPQPTQG